MAEGGRNDLKDIEEMLEAEEYSFDPVDEEDGAEMMEVTYGEDEPRAHLVLNKFEDDVDEITEEQEMLEFNLTGNLRQKKLTSSSSPAGSEGSTVTNGIAGFPDLNPEIPTIKYIKKRGFLRKEGRKEGTIYGLFMLLV